MNGGFSFDFRSPAHQVSHEQLTRSHVMPAVCGTMQADPHGIKDTSQREEVHRRRRLEKIEVRSRGRHEERN